MPSVTPRHPLSQPNHHSSAEDADELPTLPRRPRVPAEPPPAATDTGSPAIEPTLPRPLDAAHHALPVPDPSMPPLPPVRTASAPAPVADKVAQPAQPAPPAPLP